MTDLQMSLIGGAVVFVGAVFVYNKWQEHKARKSVERAFSSEHDDVLMRSGAAPERAPGAELRPRRRRRRSSGGDGAERFEPALPDTGASAATTAKPRRPNWPPAWSTR